MKRLLALPLASLCACTITVAPIKDKPRTYWHKQTNKHSANVAKSAPAVSPVIKQIHEQYKPIYEKLPPEPQP